MIGVDVSNFTGVPSPDQLAALYAKGYRFAIPGTQTGLDGNCYTAGQIAAFQTAGFQVPAVYVFLYWDGNDPGRVTDAMKYGLPVWLDCEWKQAQVAPPTVIGQAVVSLGQQCAGIYTGSWWWVPFMQNSSELSYLPLWHAAYFDDGHVPAFSEFQPYGGWAKPTIWQYSSGGDAGLNADLDVMEDAA